MFYWAAVLATFALGTAAGDLTAVTFGLGYFGSGLMFAAIIAIPALGYFRFGMNSILAFWFAYVVTRPLGASFADWLAVSSARGGLALGTGPVSLVLAAMIAAFVAYLSRHGQGHAARSGRRRRRGAATAGRRASLRNLLDAKTASFIAVQSARGTLGSFNRKEHV